MAKKAARDASVEAQVLRHARTRLKLRRQLSAVEDDLTEALRAANKKGVSVTVLSGLSKLSRPTIYDRLK